MELATYACQSVLESSSHDIIFYTFNFQINLDDLI